MDSMNAEPGKTVYFVRHGQSVDNVSPVFQSANSPLSEKGERQAKSIAARLSNIEFETLIASPVLRAKQTAEYISKETGKDIIFSDFFVERIKPDEVDGKPWADKQADKIWQAWEETLFTSGRRVSNGENYEDIVGRTDKAIDFLLGRPEANLTVVTHGYFLRALIIRMLLGDNLTGAIMRHFQEQVPIENTAITVLKYEKSFSSDFTWRLHILNDHSHFA